MSLIFLKFCMILPVLLKYLTIDVAQALSAKVDLSLVNLMLESRYENNNRKAAPIFLSVLLGVLICLKLEIFLMLMFDRA